MKLDHEWFARTYTHLGRSRVHSLQNQSNPLSLSDDGSKWLLLWSLLHSTTKHLNRLESFLSTSALAVKPPITAHSGRVWGTTPVQSVLKRSCKSTIVGGASVRVTSHRQTARFEKGVKILVDKKKKHWVDFYHYRVVVYTRCQHTFQFKQLIKVHVALYDHFK